jgi:lysophospholipase
MNASIAPARPELAVVPSNPVPEGARVGYFRTEDKVRLRYAAWPKTQGALRGTV